MIGSTSYPHEGTTTTNARIMILFAIIVAGLLRSLRARMRSQRDVSYEQTLRRWNETDVLAAAVHELSGLDFVRSNNSQAGAEMLFRHGHCCMIFLRKRKRKRTTNTQIKINNGGWNDDDNDTNDGATKGVLHSSIARYERHIPRFWLFRLNSPFRMVPEKRSTRNCGGKYDGVIDDEKHTTACNR